MRNPPSSKRDEGGRGRTSAEGDRIWSAATDRGRRRWAVPSAPARCVADGGGGERTCRRRAEQKPSGASGGDGGGERNFGDGGGIARHAVIILETGVGMARHAFDQVYS